MLKKITLTFLLIFSIGVAKADGHSDMQSIKNEIENLKKDYEKRISELESKLSETQKKSAEKSSLPATSGRSIKSNAFNPSIGIILNGKWNKFSSDTSEIAGFALSHEGERKRSGFAVDHTELNFSSNIDDKFYGSMVAAIAYHDGAETVELEEAFFQTLPGFGLPNGMSIKGGRAFWTLGYLNEHHAHADDFADRPLTNRVLLNNSFNDDGFEFSYILPSDFYTEIGGGLFRGDDFPFGTGDGKSQGGWSAYARIGGDIGLNQSWRLGYYNLTGEAAGGRTSNEDNVTFIGDTDLQVADLRYTWAPTGNARDRELTFQAETFWRDETGTYEDAENSTGAISVNTGKQSVGSYAQLVYKFNSIWRFGMRYSILNAPDVPSGLSGSALDAGGHDPEAKSAMIDWTNSEFSRVRLQYNYEELSAGVVDNQWMLQYIMSIGAHGAHKY